MAGVSEVTAEVFEILQFYNDFVANENLSLTVCPVKFQSLLKMREELVPAVSNNPDALTVVSCLRECVTSLLAGKEEELHTADHVHMLVDLCWEKLHTGVWRDVGKEWRMLYGLSCLIQVCLLSVHDMDSNLARAVMLCDKALMMGHPVIGDVIHSLVNKLTEVLSAKQISKLHTCVVHRTLEPPTIEYPIKVCSDVSIVQFKTEVFGVEPVVIPGMLSHWPCMSTRRWDLQYLCKIAGCRTVPIEIGSKYTDSDWKQELMLLSDFVEEYVTSENPPSIAYLAQHSLFDQIPTLRRDISTPDYCAVSDCEGEGGFSDVTYSSTKSERSISSCFQSESVYLEPISIGTVLHPAILHRYWRSHLRVLIQGQ